MKAKPVKETKDGDVRCSPEEATHVWLSMPGPMQHRRIPVILRGPRRGTTCWTWNGDTESPTLKPSIRSRDGTHVCHSFVNDGKVQFLADCTHELAGQTLDLLEVE